MLFVDNLKRFLSEPLAKMEKEAQHKFMDKDISQMTGGAPRICPAEKDAIGISAETEASVGAQRQLARIEAALSRIKAGTFGFCRQCGGEISLETLSEDPTTAICGKCKPQ